MSRQLSGLGSNRTLENEFPTQKMASPQIEDASFKAFSFNSLPKLSATWLQMTLEPVGNTTKTRYRTRAGSVYNRSIRRSKEMPP